MKLLKVLFSLFTITFLLNSCQKDVPQVPNKPPVVNAGRDTTIQLKALTDSIKLNGSATDSGGTVVSYLWSQVSGPANSVIVNPGSAVTYATGLKSGTYVFQLMATDEVGATGVKSVSYTIILPKAVTLTLQPHQSPWDMMMALFNGVDVSNPAAGEFGAIAWTKDGNPATVRGLFQFDLSSIPADAKTSSAKLTLYSNPTPSNGDLIHANAGPSNSMLIQRIVSDWNSTTKWQNQPATDATTQLLVPHTNTALLDLTDLDVTNMVKDMVTKSNHGFTIKLEQESIYNSRIFCSSKYPDATKHPKLVVEYSR